MTSACAGFADRLCSRIDDIGSPLCVGIDPVLDKLPEGCIEPGNDPATSIARFCDAVIDAVAPHAAAVKFQSACFERYGAPGWEALAGAVEMARASGLIAILDGKRGDIGVSAAHYAASAAEGLGVDAVTVNPYLGPSGVVPFIEAGLGVFALVRTSNPDSDELQAQPLADGRTVAELVAEQVARLGRDHLGDRGVSGVGAVVGATKAGDAIAGRLRSAMPDQVFLVPGIGAQGGRVEDLVPLLRGAGGIIRRCADAGMLVTASRSVTYPRENGLSWSKQVGDAARTLGVDLASVIQKS